jgi:PEP-CTERM motif
MKFNSLRFLVIPLVAVLFVPISAAATTIDFSSIGGPGDLGSATYVDAATGLTVSGLWLDDATWKPANLYVRDQPNDHGLGICSPADDPPCPGPDGGGDFNELDNEDANELIRLTLPDGYRWESVQLSSLDNNDGAGFEYGQLWADLDGDPTSLDTVLWQFRGDGPVEPSFLIPGSAATAPYLFFQPFDWSPGGLSSNNDFLVYQASITQTRVPEPATIGILGIGLLALVRPRRKR